VTAVRIPLLAAGESLRLYKVSRRDDLDISTFGAAVWMRLAVDHTIADIRIAYGGVGPMVVRMKAAEDFLRGGPTSLDSFTQAGEIAADSVKPISDVRGSERFRRTLAKNILVKFWHDMDAGGPEREAPSGGNGHPAVVIPIPT
jgi:xanthine dehydrogenase small subunit